jgi:hypothetical protein
MRALTKGAVIGVLVAGVASAVGVSAQGQAAQTDNRLMGTWTFNAQKSKLSNFLPPRKIVRKYEDRGNGMYIFQQEMIDAANRRVMSMYVAREDGREYPMVIQNADDFPSVYIAFKRVDANTVEQTEKSPAGNVTANVTRTISGDGKTMTLTIRAGAGGGGGDDAANSPAAQAARRAAPADIMVFEKS